MNMERPEYLQEKTIQKSYNHKQTHYLRYQFYMLRLRWALRRKMDKELKIGGPDIKTHLLLVIVDSPYHQCWRCWRTQSSDYAHQGDTRITKYNTLQHPLMILENEHKTFIDSRLDANYINTSVYGQQLKCPTGTKKKNETTPDANKRTIHTIPKALSIGIL